MNEVGQRESKPGLRLFVAMASYGDKNLELLKRIIRNYQSMPLRARIVVLSDKPKDLGPGVEVMVGLPTKDPWSLPFAHKAVFAKAVEDHDLFLYSEDDVLFTERNIRAFLKATSELPAEEIAGFLLYEKDQAGTVWLTSMYGHWHWLPQSVRRRGSYTVAEFSNQHSASYLLTQAQLRRAIESGGFLKAPYEHNGLYDLLCTAATDPYTSCGLRKVICISEVEDFLVHHTPDKYTHISCVSLPSLKEEMQTLMDICEGRHPSCTLYPVEARFRHFRWQKAYYERPDEALLAMIPRDAKTVLSVGCGWGATEARLKDGGAKVTALPLNSLIGSVAARRGIEVVHGRWEDGLRALNGRRFDCVLMKDVLHLQPEPGPFMTGCVEHCRKDGAIVIGGPNFGRLSWRIKRGLNLGGFGSLRSFRESGISACGPKSLAKDLKRRGFQVNTLKWTDHGIGAGPLRGKQVCLGGATAREWILLARRTGACS